MSNDIPILMHGQSQAQVQQGQNQLTGAQQQLGHNTMAQMQAAQAQGSLANQAGCSGAGLQAWLPAYGDYVNDPKLSELENIFAKDEHDKLKTFWGILRYDGYAYNNSTGTIVKYTP